MTRSDGDFGGSPELQDWESDSWTGLYEADVAWRPAPPPDRPCVEAPSWLAAPAPSLGGIPLLPSSAALWPEGEAFVILVHGVAVEGPLWRLYGRIARGLQKRGVACALLFLPGHGPRARGPALSGMSRLSVAEALAVAHGAVSEARSLARWGRERYGRAGLLGVSLGGMVGTIALALERTLDGGLLVVTGGGLSSIVRHGAARFFLPVGGTALRAASLVEGASYGAYLERVALRGWRSVRPSSAAFLVDPLTFAPLVGRERVRMILTRWAPVVPYRGGVDLWRALGRPPLDRVPGAHGSVLLFQRDLIVRRLVEAIASY